MISIGSYLNRVSLNYIDYDTKQAWDKNTNPSDNLVLDKVVTYAKDNIINEYQFAYNKPFVNSSWVNAQTRRILLTSITKKGFQGKGEQRPTSFCYKSLKDSNNPEVCNGTDVSQLVDSYTPNDIYMVSFDNGYGGKVTYNYEKVANIDKICSVKEDNIKTCGDIITPPALKSGFNQPGKYFASYYRVANVIASNGLGQEKKTEYKYEGSSVGYTSEVVRIGGIPGTGEAKLVLQGLQFLGYPQVQIKVTDNADSNKVLSNVKSYTYQFIENDTCVMVDPRYGSEYRNEILDTNNNVLGYTDNKIIVRQGLDCLGDPKKWGEKEVYSKEVYSELDGKKSKQENFYDFEIYGDKSDQYGNVVKAINHGNPDSTGDEVYLYSLFLTSDRFAFYQKEGLVPNSLKFSDYQAKNLISLVAGSFVTAENYSKPEDVPEDKRLNFSRLIYDQRLDDWQRQAGTSGVRGLLSQTQQIYFGTSADKTNEKNTLNTFMAYNKYGLQIRSANPDGQKSYVFYDSVLGSIPVCTVSVASDGVKDLDKKGQDELCNISEHRGKKIVQKLGFENEEAILRQLPNYSEDQNGARTSYKFDEYGRVVEVFAPKLDKPNESLEFASQTAYYYDNLTPMRTRTQVKTLLPDNTEIVKVSDSFMDGFGNPYQTIAYNNLENKNGEKEYAFVSYQTFNGIGQVTNKVTNIPVYELKPDSLPKLVEQSVLDKNIKLASTEQTTYDYFSRPTQVTITLGGENGSPVTKTIKTSYNGYEVNATDAVNNQVKRVIDGLGREIKTVNYLCSNDTNCNESNGKAIEVNTKLDILGNPIEIKDSEGITIKTAKYNTASMPLQVTDSDRGESKIYYDQYGRNFSVVDAKGSKVENMYDGFGRVIKTYIKDSVGNIFRESNNEYDTDKIGALYKTELKGYVLGTTTGIIQTISNKTNLIGAPTEVRTTTVDINSLTKDKEVKYITKIDSNTYSNTGLLINTKSKLEGANDLLDDISYEYNKDLELKKLTDNTITKPLLNSIVSDYKGQVLGYTLGDNMLQISNTYDNQSRLLQKLTVNGKSQGPVPTLVDKLVYGYNDASNIVKFSSNNSEETKTFKYDSFSRLTAVAGQYVGEYKISDVGALNYKKEGPNLTENVFVSDLIKTNSDPCSVSEYLNLTGYVPRNNTCPYHAVLYSTVNGTKTTYLYDRNGNIEKEVYTTASGQKTGHRLYKYKVLDLPLEIEDFDKDGKSINLTKFVYGMGGQRIGKIGKTVSAPVIATPKITPTPVEKVVATPVITPSAIVAVGSVTVKATTTTPKAVVRYTDNGKAVTASSVVMPANGVVISATSSIVKKTIKVKAFLAGYKDSPEVSKTYSVSPKVNKPVSKPTPKPVVR